MKKLTLLSLTVAIISSTYSLHAQVPVKATHVIIVMEENYAYSEIIGSASAPTLTALSKTSYTANFTQDYAIQHPSSPNYLELFSGSCQTDCSLGDYNGPLPGSPFNDCNLGSSLIQSGYTFVGYSEDQPSAGWISGNSGNYYTKHCPWINWIGYNTNPDTIPLQSDLPYSSFPDSTNYTSLPTVCWVIPNIIDDMHDPSNNPAVAISNGDTWFKSNIMPLVRWASNPANKTIVITTWDEDDGNYNNNIALLVSSGLVNGGNYSTSFTHYDVLKTIEDMYDLTDCGASSSGIDMPVAIWKATGINSITETDNTINTWPVPATYQLNVKIKLANEANATISIYDIAERMIKEIPTQLKSGENTIEINTGDIANGFYFLTVTGENIALRTKIVITK